MYTIMLKTTYTGHLSIIPFEPLRTALKETCVYDL